MFFGSVTRNLPDTASPRGLFLRDLAASLATLCALGGLLMVIQLHSGAAIAGKPVNKALHAPQKAVSPVEMAARQPSDEAATPDADEERIAKAMVAFALSKVSPLQPEPIASIPALPAPVAQAFAPAKKVVRTPASPRIAPALIPTGIGQSTFRQPEWPQQASVLRYSVLQKEEPSRFSLTRLEVSRLVPGTQTVVNGAQTLASGARKSVGSGVIGLRNGVSAMQERAIAITARIW